MVTEVRCGALLVVKLTPEVEPTLPTAAPDIFARLKRILFNAPLLHDLESLGEMQQMLRRSRMLPADLRRLRDLKVEEIAIDHGHFGSANGSALDPNTELLSRLHEAGRTAADQALAARAIFR